MPKNLIFKVAELILHLHWGLWEGEVRKKITWNKQSNSQMQFFWLLREGISISLNVILLQLIALPLSWFCQLPEKHISFLFSLDRTINSGMKKKNTTARTHTQTHTQTNTFIGILHCYFTLNKFLLIHK